MRQKSKKEHRLDAELELIIDEIAGAVRTADRGYVAQYSCFTPRMRYAVGKFYAWCEENYLEKA